MPAEIVAIDSRSSDGTLAILRRRCDQVISIEPAAYRPGRALNLAAAAAAGDILFALSSHCRVPRSDWIERSLALYADTRVAATNGAERDPRGRPLARPHLQTPADVRANPYWGFSNHASSWRAAVWRDHPFSETLPTAEDKEWALRVLQAGWTIAYDPLLTVEMTHRWRQGTLRFFQRERLETLALGTYLELRPYGARQLAREWWSPPNPRRALPRERANPRRMAGLLGKYLGHRAALRRRT